MLIIAFRRKGKHNNSDSQSETIKQQQQELFGKSQVVGQTQDKPSKSKKKKAKKKV